MTAVAITDLIRVALVALFLLASGIAYCDNDPSVRFQKARSLAQSGEPDRAIDILDELRKEYPRDVDYPLARAQILAREGRDVEAIDDLHVALLLAPDYEEVWQLQRALLARQPGDEARHMYEAFLQAASSRFPDAKWWQAVQIEPTVQWSLLAGLGYQRLSNGLPSWDEQFVEIAREHDRWGRYRAGVARNARYDDSDISILLGGDVSFASHWLAGLSTTFASDPVFQPELEWNANVGRTLSAGWVVGLGYRHREYQDTAVSSVTGTVEKYIGDYRVAYAMGSSRLPDAPTLLHHGLTVNKYYDNGSRLGITLSSGKEAEVIGPGQVLETSVRGLSLNGSQQLTDRLGLQWWLGTHDQGDFYRRDYFGLAVSIQL